MEWIGSELPVYRKDSRSKGFTATRGPFHPRLIYFRWRSKSPRGRRRCGHNYGGAEPLELLSPLFLGVEVDLIYAWL